jgi:hypothetical protein
MAKTDVLLKAFQANVGNWVCGYCNSNSNQPAATFRELKKLGYSFEETTPGRWGKNVFCKNCGAFRSHYKLLKKEAVHSEKPRIGVKAKDRERILDLFDRKDAFTGGSISSTPEIDHKIPWTRLKEDIDASLMSDSEVRAHFQLLTREHNLLKDRACGSCGKTDKRPPLFGIEFWYIGDENYRGDCIGCGWHDGEKWRTELNKLMHK